MAPKKNNFYLLRSKHGRDKAYTPEELKTSCYEYFARCDSSPWYKNEAVKSGDQCGKILKVPTQRPYTKTGLYIFLNINRQTWDNYKGSEDYLAIIEEVENIIYDQKFTGAAVGCFNPNIIARDLGLKERTEQEITGKNGAPLDLSFSNLPNISSDDLLKFLSNNSDK
jgi:hypothetical protein